MRLGIVVFLLTIAANRVAGQAPDTLLADARQFVASLKLEQTADAKLYRETGLEKSRTLLMAVINRGQERSATLEDWAALHRAANGIVELFLEQGAVFQASLFASLQDGFYRNLEHDYAAALKSSQRALELQRQAGQLETIDIPLSNVGRNYFAEGNPEEALKFFQQARDACKDPLSKRAARTHRDIVQAELALKRTDDARHEVTRFSDLASTAPAEFRAIAWMAQSDLLVDEERFEPAVSAIRSAREAMRGTEAAPVFEYEIFSQLMSCVLASMRSIPYRDALALAQRIDTEFTGLPIPVAAFAKQSILVRRRMAGEIDAVLREQTADLEASKLAGSVGGQIVALQGIATTYRFSNSVRGQITALEQAIDLDRTRLKPDGMPSDTANASSLFRNLNALGDAYLDLHEPGKARKCFSEVTKKIEAFPDATGQKRLAKIYGEAMLGKARLAGMDDDPDTARELLEKALRPDPRSLAEYSHADVLLQAARLERDLKEHPAAAKGYYEQAVEIYRDQKDIQTETAVRLEFARFLVNASGKVPDALGIAERQLIAAAVAVDSLRMTDLEWRLSFERGELQEAQSHPAAAIQAYEEAVAKLDQLRAGLSQQEQRQALVGSDLVQDLYRRLIALLSATGKEAEAWRYMERARARSFLEALGGRRFQSASPAPALKELALLEKRMADLRMQLTPQNESLLRGAGQEPSVIQNGLRELEARYLFARQQAALRETRAGQVLALDPLPLADARRLVPKDAVLVEFAILNDSLTAIVISAGQSREVSWPVNTARLRGNVVRLRSLLADEHSGEEMSNLLASVSKDVLAPLAPALPATLTKLIVVPSGVLNYLPFQTLSLPDGRALIERFAITYLPSASSLQFLGPADKFSGDLFLGALGKVSVDGWAPLPGTILETDAIARIYPHAARSSESAFTHNVAQSALLEHSAVHFATHGVLDEQAPLFSAILTGPASGQPSRLSLYELMETPLRARLVVLSACETGLGKLMGGDEVASLTRTFLLAGANTVVSSLWKVSDDATALLMEGFYRGLQSGATPGDALRASALAVRKRYPHPFYWAPFIVTGTR